MPSLYPNYTRSALHMFFYIIHMSFCPFLVSITLEVVLVTIKYRACMEVLRTMCKGKFPLNTYFRIRPSFTLKFITF